MSQQQHYIINTTVYSNMTTMCSIEFLIIRWANRISFPAIQYIGSSFSKSLFILRVQSTMQKIFSTFELKKRRGEDQTLLNFVMRLSHRRKGRSCPFHSVFGISANFYVISIVDEMITKVLNDLKTNLPKSKGHRIDIRYN